MRMISIDDFSEKLRSIINAKYKKNTDFYREFEKRYNFSIESPCKQWLKGTNYPKTDTLIYLCDILDCDFEYFLTEQEEFKRTDKKITDLTGLSKEAITTLERLLFLDNGYIDILNFILSDGYFFKFIRGLKLYIENDYNIVMVDKLKPNSNTIELVPRDAPEYDKNGNERFWLGKKTDNGYGCIPLSTDIVEAHAMLIIQEALKKWQTKYKKECD